MRGLECLVGAQALRKNLTKACPDVPEIYRCGAAARRLWAASSVAGCWRLERACQPANPRSGCCKCCRSRDAAPCGCCRAGGSSATTRTRAGSTRSCWCAARRHLVMAQLAACASLGAPVRSAEAAALATDPNGAAAGGVGQAHGRLCPGADAHARGGPNITCKPGIAAYAQRLVRSSTERVFRTWQLAGAAAAPPKIPGAVWARCHSCHSSKQPTNQPGASRHCEPCHGRAACHAHAQAPRGDGLPWPSRAPGRHPANPNLGRRSGRRPKLLYSSPLLLQRRPPKRWRPGRCMLTEQH
jgi:hypothetical protein